MIVEVYSEPGRTIGDRVLSYIRAYIAVHHGLPPTQREIAKGLSLGLTTVWQALLELEMTDRIRRAPGARTIRLVDIATENQPHDNESHEPERRAMHG